VVVSIRALGADDVELVKWALYTAVSWNPARELPAYELLIEHPELARYHRDWGRPGDLGVAAQIGEEVVGVAFCRVFTDEDHGHGYVDPETPEIGIAVRDDQRGRGLGGRLLEALAAAARAGGVTRLSLSVDAGNPALRLYERIGYRELARDEGGVRMLLVL
jgi:ribosomal protein S18 acetylase RimI-like enzyme